MRPAANVIVVLVSLACLTGLVVSVYPGVLNDLLLLTVIAAFLVLPVVGAIALIGVVVLVWKGKLRRIRVPWAHGIVIVGIVFCTYVLLKFYVPRRIAFAASRGAFEQVVVHAASSDDQQVPLHHRLGVFHVDAYAVDPRGGVYFRVYSGLDGIGPDVMSYGFVHKPNTHGTPFGAARYRVFRLGNDWCWFHASDDW